MSNAMHFAAGLTTSTIPQEACQALIDQVQNADDPIDYDLAVVFVSPHYALQLDEISRCLREQLSVQHLIGCAAGGLVGPSEEVEQHPAISLLVGRLPGVTLTPFSLQGHDLNETLEESLQLTALLQLPADVKAIMLLADPFTTPMDLALQAFNNVYPNVPLVGGLASAAVHVGGNTLTLNEALFHVGAVGLAFSGPVEVDVIVSQGCRPIGEPLQVTAAEQNMITRLNDEIPITVLRNLLETMSPTERALVQEGLFIGRAIDIERDTPPGRGDFLIRGVMGVDRETGALAIGDHIQTGETVQFQVRDAATAQEDLEMLLSPQLFYDEAAGGLAFLCNGRGTRLYKRPNSDIDLIQGVLGQIPLAGFFCAGELGPIGNHNFLHGHTASLLLFRSQV